MEKHFIPILIFVVLGNLFAYWIKSILENNNYKVNFFSGHFRDAKNIFKLVRLTSDKLKRKYYFIIGLLNILSGIGFIVSFIVLVAAGIKEANDAPCNSYKDFKSYTYDYLIINKYVDLNEHSYRTLILQDGNGNKFKNLDLNFDQSELFEFISIGDSIKKAKGTDLVNILNSKIDTTLEVDFGCEEK